MKPKAGNSFKFKRFAAIGITLYVAVTMLQLSNIAWEVNRELHLDTTDGKIKNDPEAMKGWGREYEKGWAPRLT